MIFLNLFCSVYKNSIRRDYHHHTSSFSGRKVLSIVLNYLIIDIFNVCLKITTIYRNR